MTEAVIEDLAMSGDGEQFLVLLRAGGNRVLPIAIDAMQAMSIAAGRSEEPLVERPLTHDLMTKVLGLLGAEVVRVEITDLIDGTYYAMLVLERDGARFDVDARPSDALALAVRCGAPILVAERVLDENALDDLGGDEGFEEGFEGGFEA